MVGWINGNLPRASPSPASFFLVSMVPNRDMHAPRHRRAGKKMLFDPLTRMKKGKRHYEEREGRASMHWFHNLFLGAGYRLITMLAVLPR